MKPDKPDSRERIKHIIMAIELILTYAENIDFIDFVKDKKTYFATLYQYTIIGEAVGKIDNEIIEKYDYPWYKVKSFRNFILHEYHAIDERVVWDTTKHVLPEPAKIMRIIFEN